jgi:hypothetical protein
MTAVQKGFGLLAVALLAMAPALRAANPPKDSEEVSGFFSEAKAEAVQLQFDAEELNNFARSKTSWQTHADKLTQMKEHVNKVSALVTKMNAAKADAAPWQQQAIERINPMLNDLATTVSAAINHLSKNQDRLMHPPYPDYAAATASTAIDMAGLISDYVDYGETRHHLDDLSRQLETPQD